MTLEAPALERRLRRAVRAAAPDARRPWSFTWLGRAVRDGVGRLFVLAWGLWVIQLIVGRLPSAGFGAGTLHLMAAVFAAGLACVGAAGLVGSAGLAEDLHVCAGLPVPDAVLLRRRWQRHMRGSRLSLALLVAAGAGAVAYLRGDAAAHAAAAAGALLTWLAALGAAPLLAAAWPRARWSRGTLAVWLGPLAVYACGRSVEPALVAAGHWPLLAFPLSWASAVQLLTWDGPAWLGVLALGPLVLSVAGLATARRRADGGTIDLPAQLLVTGEGLVEDWEDLGDAPTPAPEAFRDPRREARGEATATALQAGGLPDEARWPRPAWLDLAIGTALGVRRRRVMACLAGDPPRLGRQWVLGMRWILIGGLAGGLTHAAGWAAAGMLMALVTAAIGGLMVLGRTWPGLVPGAPGGPGPPPYAVLPVGFRDVAWASLVYDAVALLALGPAALLAVAWIARLGGQGPHAGLVHGFAGLGVALAAVPVLVSVRVSPGTDDLSRLWWRRLLLGAAGVLSLVVLAGSAIAGVALARSLPLAAGAGVGGVALAAWGWLGLYALAYDRWRMDLLRPPPAP